MGSGTLSRFGFPYEIYPTSVSRSASFDSHLKQEGFQSIAPNRESEMGWYPICLEIRVANQEIQLNQKSRMSSWAIPALVLSLAISGCAKKPKQPADESVAGGGSQVSPSRSTPDVSDEELRRQRLIAEAREVFQTIYYPLDQSILDAKARMVLAGIHKFMTNHSEVSLTVAGHCDERGTGEYNLALGEQRARAVTRYLADLGVPDSRMKTLSYGEERPASDGHSESSWALNRRAEFTPEFRFELSGTSP